MSDICQAPMCRAGLTPRELARGLLFCGACRDRLARQLADLPTLYKGSERVLEHRRHHTSERVSGWRPACVCLDDSVVEVRSAMVEVLVSWCLMIMGERGVAGPGQRTVECLAAYLHAHLNWLVAHTAAADFASEIDELVNRARDVVGPARKPDIELGPCAAPDCGAVVRAIIGHGGESAAYQVICEAGHVWQPGQWLALRRRIDQAGRRPDGASRRAVRG